MNVEKEILELRLEIAKLSSRVYDGRDLEPDRPRNELKGKTPRQIMEMISRGKIQNQHVGKKSKQVLIQEGFSLKNRFNADTMTNTELDQYHKDLKAWENDILNSDVINENDIKEIVQQIYNLLKGTPS